MRWRDLGLMGAVIVVLILIRPRPGLTSAPPPAVVDVVASRYGAQLDALQREVGDLTSLLASRDRTLQPSGAG